MDSDAVVLYFKLCYIVRVKFRAYTRFNVCSIIFVPTEFHVSRKSYQAKPETKHEKLRKKIEKDVLEWEFKPFVHKNETKKVKGFIYYYKK